MIRNRLPHLLAVLLVFAILTLGALAADNLQFRFDYEGSAPGWSTQYLRYNYDPGYFNGYAFEKSANLIDPGFISPTLDIQAEDYPYVIIRMKFSLDASWNHSGTVFFQTDGMNEFNQATSASFPFEKLSYGSFTDFVVDMTKNEKWTGHIKRVRVDPFEAPGSIGLESITFTSTLPEAEPETTKPADNSGTETEKKKESGYFEKPYTYDGRFTDVPQTEWYAPEIAKAYELGLINGKSDTVFDPDGGMTVAEAITLAARTKNNYGAADADFTAKAGEAWYAPYVAYAEVSGITAKDVFDDFDRPATRGEMAYLFSRALPNAEYASIASVASIPDVPQTHKYFSNILKLYTAGIVAGNDAVGTYNPESGVTRAEAAAILNRICNKDSRIRRNIAVERQSGTGAFVMSSEAKYLMDDVTFTNRHTGGVGSGWDVKETLSAPSKSAVWPSALKDDSPEREAYFTRKFLPVSDGVLDFEFGAAIYGNNGAYIAFTDENRTDAVRVELVNGAFCVKSPDGSLVDTGARCRSSSIHFNLYIDFAAHTFDLGIDGAYIGTYPLAANVPVSAFYYGVTKEGCLTITASYAFLRHNFLTVEKFVNAPDAVLPYDLRVIAENGYVAKENLYTADANGGTAALRPNAGGKAGIAKSFAPVSGNVVFETYVLLPENTDGAKIALKSGASDAFFLTASGGNFLAPDGKTVKNVVKNLWTIVRFEADTAAGTALVKINGKPAGTYAFASPAAAIDGYEITFASTEASVMYVDDIKAYVALPYPADYVPEPVIPDGDDYLVGLNVCSLWRTGTHYGWDEIAQYDEIEPVLGYYDEGSPEVSDWEIKFMSEHGIDYEIFCWYPTNSINAPIFRSPHDEAIFDGYMNARYSDKLRFAVMWENSGAAVKTMDDWKNYMVPYLIEYFFKDERYLKIDNKPLFTVWNTKFGDISSKEALDVLRDECRKAGFAGCEVMFYGNGGAFNPAFGETVKAAGGDSIGVYHYGSSGADVNKQLASLAALESITAVNTIPAVSVGFQNLGWGYGVQNRGLLPVSDYHIVTDEIKRILAGRDPFSPYSKTVIISTWNEYGEGTYVMPTVARGFGYLDGVRAAFTKGGAHEDAVPTPAQKQRINYLYDQSRRWLAPQLAVTAEETAAADPFAAAEVVKSLDLSAPMSGYGISDVTYNADTGILSLKATGNDPAIFYKDYFTAVPAADANAVHIRARITGNQSTVVQLFFRTSDGKEYSASKCANAALVQNEWADYYFDFSKNKEWTGSIVNLRFDPVNYKFDLTEISAIEFIRFEVPEEVIPYTVDVNGGKLAFIKDPEIRNGHVFVPLYPETGVPASMRSTVCAPLARMKAAYTWDKYNKILTVFTNEHSVTFTAGSATAVADGKNVTLTEPVTMYDGLPVLPIDTLAVLLGYAPVFHEDGNGLSIMTAGADSYEVIKNRKEYEYEFNLEGDVEDWTLQALSEMTARNGVLHCVSNGRDPAVSSPALKVNASLYPIIKVRMRFNRDNADSNDMAVIYFRTASAGLSESRTVRIQDLPVSSNGEYVEYTFKMGDHLQWNGTITGIRFDPFNATGSFDIDYIRFEKDPATAAAEALKAEREKNLDDTVVNGDAETVGYNPMYSGNSTITIVTRDDGGHCYNVKANSGKVWTYLRQDVKFVPDTAYVIEFDARLTGTNDGRTDDDLGTTIHANLIYHNGDKVADHFKAAGSLKVGEGWTHCSAEIAVGKDCTEESNVFAVYTNPIGDCGVNYEIDNIVLRKK